MPFKTNASSNVANTRKLLPTVRPNKDYIVRINRIEGGYMTANNEELITIGWEPHENVQPFETKVFASRPPYFFNQIVEIYTEGEEIDEIQLEELIGQQFVIQVVFNGEYINLKSCRNLTDAEWDYVDSLEQDCTEQQHTSQVDEGGMLDE